MAFAAASSRLLALVGMTAIVPGSVQPELDELRIPIFAALGEHDLGGTLDVLPGQLPACGDLTLFLLEGAGHNHNVAVNRRLLWDRVDVGQRPSLPDESHGARPSRPSTHARHCELHAIVGTMGMSIHPGWRLEPGRNRCTPRIQTRSHVEDSSDAFEP